MLELAGQGLSIEQLVAVAREHEPVAALGDEVCRRMQCSHEWVRNSIHQPGKIIFGVLR